MFWLLLWRCSFYRLECVCLCVVSVTLGRSCEALTVALQRGPLKGKLALCVCACMPTTGIGHRVERPPVRKEGKGRKQEGGVIYTFWSCVCSCFMFCVNGAEWSRYRKGNQRRARKETIHSFTLVNNLPFRLFRNLHGVGLMFVFQCGKSLQCFLYLYIFLKYCLLRLMILSVQKLLMFNVRRFFSMME